MFLRDGWQLDEIYHNSVGESSAFFMSVVMAVLDLNHSQPVGHNKGVGSF